MAYDQELADAYERIRQLEADIERLQKSLDEIYSPPTYASGDKVDFNWRTNDYRFICCRCGKVHILRFVVSGDKIRMRVWAEDVLKSGG
jgi:hypothetical protein